MTNIISVPKDAANHLRIRGTQMGCLFLLSFHQRPLFQEAAKPGATKMSVQWDLDLMPLGAEGIPAPVILREGSTITLPSPGHGICLLPNFYLKDLHLFLYFIKTTK